MAFVVADRVKETCTGTSGAMSLAGAVTGFQTFVAGIGDNNTCPYVIEDADGSAWEVGIGTVDDATPDTLTRTTFLASSTGSAVTFSGGTHTVYCGWQAQQGLSSYLHPVTGANAATTMEVGQLYVVDVGAFTADRTYTLPATAAVGDRCGIMVSTGDDAYELLVTAASGDTLNGVAGGTEWSRVFITGEVLIFRCIAANATWVVEHDGRKPCVFSCYLTTTADGETAATWTVPTSASTPGAWTLTVNTGDAGSTSASKFVARRAGNYAIGIRGRNNDQHTAEGRYFGIATFDASSTYQVYAISNSPGTSLYTAPSSNSIVAAAVGEEIIYKYISENGSKGLAGYATPAYTAFSVVEVL